MDRQTQERKSLVRAALHCDQREFQLSALGEEGKCANRTMETTEDYRQRVIRTSDERKEFVMDVDGFIYWWPDGSTRGHMASYHLRWIADEMDRRNADWQKQVDEYFKG